MSPSSPDRADETPHSLILDEMRRQNADALASIEAAAEVAAQVALSIRRQGQVLMLGMGASHWANRMAVAAYRAAGIDARAEVLSEAMRMPPGGKGSTLILTSQSGESGEIARWLADNPDRTDVFGMTLQPQSRLGRAVPCLIGQGGRERPFAATRSVMLTVALHAAVLEALGVDIGYLKRVWQDGPDLPPAPPVEAIQAVQRCTTLVLAARGALVPVMGCASLTFMELARTPAMALELGQLIHGPQEALGGDTVLVLARQEGPDAAGIARFARDAVDWGVPVVMIDIGVAARLDGVVHWQLDPAHGLGAIARLLPAAQSLAVEAAALRVPDFGRPQRSSKVTDGEAA